MSSLAERRSVPRAEAVATAPPPVTLVAHEVGTPGGMERQLGELVTGLLDRGHTVTAVAHACELPEHPALRVVRVPGPRRPFSLWYPWFFLAGSVAVWRRRAGLLHTTGALVFNRADVSTIHFCHRAFKAKARLTRAERTTAHYRLSAWVADLMSRLAERYCYRPARTGRLVAVSEGLARELREFFPAMSTATSVIPNGVDRRAFSPDGRSRASLRGHLDLSGDDLVALFVGGEWERKGLSYAIEAIAKTWGWHLVVVGSGDHPRYRRLARSLEVEDRVHFAGSVRDTAPYYSCADAFVLPTAYETFSLVTLEAASGGLPLLVTRVSGVEEILVNGENGWFIERDADVIAKRLVALESDSAVRHAMGEAARSASARFEWYRAIDAYHELYSGLTATVT